MQRVRYDETMHIPGVFSFPEETFEVSIVVWEIEQFDEL